MSAGPDGLLVIDKPAGMTSHDVVDHVRKLFRTRKVGHAGTLDPDATGILLVGLGRATRFLAYAQRAAKRYRATALFGVSTTTQDAAGEVVAERDCSFTEDELRRALEKFTGAIEQVPPMVSAVRVGGERLHAKARRGEEVDRAPRPVTIYELGLIAYRAGPRPEAKLDVACSSGTYVRTLIHDLGETLGCGAHMATLRRTETGGFSHDEATPLADVTERDLRPLADVVRCLPALDLDDEQAVDVSYGRRLPVAGPHDIPDGDAVALRCGGELVAVYRREGDVLVADRVVPR
ncbi:MAG TPA: tRNA pseudouridine(55) synthase TruB [Actinomycetota bacterium]|nr:tRNA pseudouridine(55) synthase TruB [Actinomycetota bacterium]